MFTRLGFIAAFVLISSEVVLAAGKCSYVITRTACSKEVEKDSFAKCKGNAKCEPVNKMVADEAACMALAVDACTNSRFKETKSKTNKVEFNGKVISEDACAADSPPKFMRKDHFDKCS